MNMRRVILESPFSSSNGREVTENIAYAEACILDCLRRGESPIASHLLFARPGILDDLVPEQRQLGIQAGHAWYKAADACVIYADHGFTAGMRECVERAAKSGINIEVRYLGISSSVATVSASSILSLAHGLVVKSDS
jgi:hypothetical protein